MTVVIAGCGDLGTEAGLRFAATGRRVLGLRRSPQKLPAEIEGQQVDLGRHRPTIPADTEIVVLALTADDRTAAGYRAAYVDTLRHTLGGIAASGARPRVLFVSSTAVYGIDDGSWVDENTAAEPASATATVLREAEITLHAAIPDATVLRLAGVYGPGRTRQIDQVREQTAVVPDQIRYTNRIHRDDAAAAIVHLTIRSQPPAPVYIGADDLPTERGELLRFLADELGVEHPRVETASHASSGNKRCSNARLRETGFELAFPTFRDGYRAVLAGHGVRHP